MYPELKNYNKRNLRVFTLLYKICLSCPKTKSCLESACIIAECRCAVGARVSEGWWAGSECNQSSQLNKSELFALSALACLCALLCVNITNVSASPVNTTSYPCLQVSSSSVSPVTNESQIYSVRDDLVLH